MSVAPRALLPAVAALSLAVAAAIVLLRTDFTPAARRPNVVLVTLDTTRPDYLSAYGGHNATPAFDALAAEGVRFDAVLSSSAVTPVSHATILTGRYQYEHGLRVLSAGSGFRLPEHEPTIATTLRAAGYVTAAVHSAFPVSGYFGFRRDYDHWDSFDGALEHHPGDTKTSWDSRVLQRRSDETTDRCLAVVREARRAGAPFFLWIHYWDPHDPIVLPPPEFLSHIDGSGDAGAANSNLYEQVYAAEVRFLDRQFGRLVEGLRAEGAYDDTLLAVTADHGEGLRDGFERHGWGKHRMTYQEQLHVPLLLRGPGVPAGPSVSQMVRTVDIVPTLLDFAGLDGTGYSGRSLRPLVEGGTLEPAVAYADQVNAYDANASMVVARPDAAFLFTVCDGEWKLTYRPHMFEATELFNLVQDPGETRNLVALHRDVYLRLMADLAARDPWVLAPFPDDGSAGDSLGQALEGLGYAGGEDGGGGSDLDWWWTCPAHPDHRRPERAGADGSRRHGEDGCTQPVVPRTEWQVPGNR